MDAGDVAILGAAGAWITYLSALIVAKGVAQYHSPRLHSREEIADAVARERDIVGVPQAIRIDTRYETLPFDIRAITRKMSDTRYEIVFNGHNVPTLSRVRHELYHIAKEHYASDSVILESIKYLFWYEPSAVLYEARRNIQDLRQARSALPQPGKETVKNTSKTQGT